MDPRWKSTSKFILLPELKIISHWQRDKFRTNYKCAKESDFEARSLQTGPTIYAHSSA